METLKITVSKTTADTLNKVANEAKIPIGAVVDRLVVNAAPEDPLIAFTLAMEQYLISISRLNKQSVTDVFGSMCAVFLGSIPPEELDYFISDIKSMDIWDYPASTIQAVTEDQINELRLVIAETLQYMRDTDTWKILSDFIHGAEW